MLIGRRRPYRLSFQIKTRSRPGQVDDDQDVTRGCGASACLLKVGNPTLVGTSVRGGSPEARAAVCVLSPHGEKTRRNQPTMSCRNASS